MNDEACVNAKEALKRIDAAVIRPVLEAVCHQVIPIARHIKKGPGFRDQEGFTWWEFQEAVGEVDRNADVRTVGGR